MLKKIIVKSLAIERGLIKYFTGDPCRKGHISERYTSTGACCKCVDGYGKAKRKLIKRKRKEALQRRKAKLLKMMEDSYE